VKQLNKSLFDFITAFELEDSLKGICFKAKLYFFTDRLKMETVSEVHIVTIDGKDLDILYILSTTIEIRDFPTMFVIGDFEVSFTHKDGLKLKSASPGLGSYTLVVQPTGKNCIEPTYQELNAKAYN